MTGLLEKAIFEGIEVRMWFIGLKSLKLHLARIRKRTLDGGHYVSEEIVRKRYTNSRKNLIRLLPKLTELKLFDNSEKADLRRGIAPKPKLLLHWSKGKIQQSCDSKDIPKWARPILAVAIKESNSKRI
jgi:predicted ABC-type ATPase